MAAVPDDGASSRFHLAQIASSGYLVIAPGKRRRGPGAKAGPSPPRAPIAVGTMPLTPNNAADFAEALDWALAENDQAGSAYNGLIDP